MSRLRSYPLQQCRLFNITSPEALSHRLGVPLKTLEGLAEREDNYSVRQERKRSGGKRTIEEPKPHLQAIHGRIHALLSRIELPDFVHSVRKGRSYITNAASHVGARSMIKLDVQQFYRRARSGAVFSFWENKMRCRRDVAGLLTRLVTYDGHLPTGSKSSPIISYWAYEPMFSEIHLLASTAGLRMTLYVDDMVVSGDGAHKGVLRSVAHIVSKHGLRSHKHKHFEGTSPHAVTGVLSGKDRLIVPQGRHMKIKDAWIAYHLQQTSDGKLQVMNRLCSMLHEIAQIDPAYRAKAEGAERMRRALRRVATEPLG